MKKESQLETHLISTYEATNFQVTAEPGFTLNVDAESEDLKLLYKHNRVNSAAFITARNPFGVILSNEENQARDNLLANELNLRSLKFIKGLGQDPLGQWPEEDSFLVFGISLEASKKLGAQFEQNAIVWSDKDAIPKLILLR
jgi:hypothetical protein